MDANAISKRAAGAAELFFKRHGPTILTAAGVGGFIATNYLTARAVLKSQDKIKNLKLKHRQMIEEHDLEDNSREETRKRAEELAKIWIRDGLDILKDFAPAIAVGSVSIFCVITSHRMMQNKQASLVAAYTALDQGFRAYRKRVEAELGEEKERELYRGVRTREIEREEGDDRPPCEVDMDDFPPGGSIYGRFFDNNSPNWSKTPEYNYQFLKGQQSYANDVLRARGHLFLNEVYDWLGIKRSQAGQSVGWLKNAREKGTGDGFVDFGLDLIFDEDSRAFTNGLESVVFLDFNVDGPIDISERKKNAEPGQIIRRRPPRKAQ